MTTADEPLAGRLKPIIHTVTEAARKSIRDYRDHKEPRSQVLTEQEAVDAILAIYAEELRVIMPEKYPPNTTRERDGWNQAIDDMTRKATERGLL